MLLSQADLQAVEREYCQRSFANFVKCAWHIHHPNAPLVWGWALEMICEHLQAVSEGKIKRLLINVPPGFGKSLLTAVYWPAWEWTIDPSKQVMATSHSRDYAVRDTRRCRELVTSQWYQSLWPVELAKDQNSKMFFLNKSGGFRSCVAFSGITGSRGDRVIFDDPHSVSSANSRKRLDETVELFRTALPTRVNSADSAIIIIMQRLAVGDVSDVAMELGYSHLCLPMEYNGASKWVVGKGDPRTEDGELLSPDFFTKEGVEGLKLSMRSKAAAGQLQQSPVAAGGNMFNDAWWRYWTVLPSYFDALEIFADTAQKTKERNDFSVFQLWGRAGNNAYLIEQIRGKWEAPALLAQAKAFWARCQEFGRVRRLSIEDKSSGTGLIQQLKNEGIPVRAIQRQKDKVQRANDALPYIESGFVFLPENAKWLGDYLDELTQFPDGAHDDQVDPTCDAITELLASKTMDWKAIL